MMTKKNFFGPWYFLGIWFSIKLDKTPRNHAIIALLLCIIHPIIGIIFYFGKEFSDGKSPKQCVGLNKCTQGFGILDFLAPLIICILWWIFLPSLLVITILI